MTTATKLTHLKKRFISCLSVVYKTAITPKTAIDIIMAIVVCSALFEFGAKVKSTHGIISNQNHIPYLDKEMQVRYLTTKKKAQIVIIKYPYK